MDNLQSGQTVGLYKIVNQIGQGGMATVYKAYQPAMDRYVAIKVLPRQVANDTEFIARFRQEARTIANLEHARILPVHDYGESDGILYFVMRYLDAGTLKDRLASGALSLSEIDRLFTQLCEALEYAHSRGVVHRDLKPANVLLDSRGNVFLSDFGIAKILENDPKFTGTGQMIGTPAYMSPEQAQGEKVDQRTDVYSLGIILYEILVGKVPFDADTPLAIVLKHINDQVPLPSDLKPDLSPAVEQVLLKALTKNPNDRFSNVSEFRTAWQKAISTEGTAQRVKTVIQPAPTKPKTTQWVWLAGVGGLLAMCLCVMIVGSALVIPSLGTSLITSPAAIRSTNFLNPTNIPLTKANTLPPATPPARTPVITNLPFASVTPTQTISLNLINVSNNPGRSTEPQLVFDKDGTLHLFWKDNSLRNPTEDILHRAMTKDGKWSEAKSLTSDFRYAFEFTGVRKPNGQACLFFNGAKTTSVNLYLSCPTQNGEWAIEQIGNSGGNRRDYQVSFATDGNVRYVYVNDTDIYFDKTRLSDGFKIASIPQLTIGKSNRYHTIWSRQGTPFSLEHRYSEDDGKSWTEPEKLTTDNDRPTGTGPLKIVADDRDNLHLVWAGYNDTYYRRWSASTKTWERTIAIGNEIHGSLNIVTDKDNLVSVIWQMGDGVWYTKQNSDEPWMKPIQLSKDSYNWGGKNPALAIDNTGKLHFVFKKNNDDASDLYYATYP